MPTLNWIGNNAVANHHLHVPFHLLKNVPDLGCGEPGDGNLIVQGDNFVALKQWIWVSRSGGRCLSTMPTEGKVSIISEVVRQP